MRRWAFLFLFRQVLGDCSSSELVGTTADTISAGGRKVVWASSHWVNAVKFTISSDDDSPLNVYTQETRDSDTYKSAASATKTVCFTLGSPVQVRSDPGSLYVEIECGNWISDCPIKYEIDFSCVSCDAEPETTTTASAWTPLDSCSSSDTASATGKSIEPQSRHTVRGTWATSVKIMVSSEEGWPIDIKTRKSLVPFDYALNVQSSNTGCYKTSGFEVVRTDPGEIYVVIDCNNWYAACPVKYDISFACEGCATTTEPASPPPCDSTCFCTSCAEALACENEKCREPTTYTSYGCQSSSSNINGVSSSTAYVWGVCTSPSTEAPNTAAPATTTPYAPSWDDYSALISAEGRVLVSALVMLLVLPGHV